MLKGNDLADYALSKQGTPYFYGAKMQPLTRDLMNRLHALYPNIVTLGYMQIAEQQAQINKINVDCSGLIGAFRGKQIGSSQLYSSAYRRLPISEVRNFARGTVLWKQGHVGVYVGDGMCVEAKGIRYGTVKTPVANTKWLYGLTFGDMDYNITTKVEGGKKNKNPYAEPTRLLKNGSSGNDVKWLQFELNESGFGLDIDGIFGNKTLAAVLTFQQSCKIEVDGIVGNNTIKCLKMI